MVISLELIQKFKPIVYVPSEGKERQLIEILYESIGEYVILWFHWPYDDFTRRPDYEPVVLVFQGDFLFKIGIRPHERYLSFDRWETLGLRPIVVFESAWHAPLIPGAGRNKIRDLKDLAGRIVGALSRPSGSIVINDYAIRKGGPPKWYNRNGTQQSVYDFASMISA